LPVQEILYFQEQNVSLSSIGTFETSFGLLSLFRREVALHSRPDER